MKKIIIGTRGSKLAIAQTEFVKRLLEEKNKTLEFKIKIIQTSGDKDLKSNWENSNNSLKSFFTREIELELLNKEIDFAVHSMKDMPVINPQGLVLGAIPIREDRRDVLISKSNFKLKDLNKNSVIGTSSLRRTMNLKDFNNNFLIKHLRGNIHTRLNKLENREYDAIILAAAGLKRVNLENVISEYLSPKEFLPAPGQGALYIQCRENDTEILELLKNIHNEKEEKLIYIEREFSKIFDGGCHTPMGCYTEYLNDNEIYFKGRIFIANKKYEVEIVDRIENYKNIAKIAANNIKESIK